MATTTRTIFFVILVVSQSTSIVSAKSTITRDEVWTAQPPPDGVSCTMCSSCDNPCNPIPYPTSPPPPPLTSTSSNCPPPPPLPTNTNYYSPPPPATYGYNFLPPYAYNYPPRYGGGGRGYNKGTPPPPNPIVPYYPFFFYSPPPAGKGSGSSSSAGTRLLRPFGGSSLLRVIFSFVLLWSRMI